MKLHYMGKYNMDPNSLPHGSHQSNYVQFKEADDASKIALYASLIAIGIFALLIAIIIMRGINLLGNGQFTLGVLASLLIIFPHEYLHALCFKGDVYLYTNFKQGMVFVVGPETMSKQRFIWMSLLPNIVFGLIPYIIGIIYPQMVFMVAFGMFAICSGAGDYYNVYNALTQMPKGSRTYLYGFHSFWYMPN